MSNGCLMESKKTHSYYVNKVISSDASELDKWKIIYVLMSLIWYWFKLNQIQTKEKILIQENKLSFYLHFCIRHIVTIVATILTIMVFYGNYYFRMIYNYKEME